jgi:molybdate transport system regulatory protein
MKVSARNAFEGAITAIHPGTINSEVVIQTQGGDSLVSIVTVGSVKSLGLAVGKKVVALVKAPWVMVATADCNLTFSARNKLTGVVSALEKGAVNTEVGIKLPGGTVVFAVITNEAVAELNLGIGQPASGIIKASHIILAVPN